MHIIVEGHRSVCGMVRSMIVGSRCAAPKPVCVGVFFALSCIAKDGKGCILCKLGKWSQEMKHRLCRGSSYFEALKHRRE